MRPYLAIPITSVCNFRCPYCDENGHGEAAASSEKFFALDYLEQVVRAAYEIGTRRFRLTGGEPFLDKRIGHIVRIICALEGVELTLDTNGSILRDAQAILSDPPVGFSIVMSLDTLRTSRISVMTGGRGKLTSILDSAKFLSTRGLLKRLNMTLTVFNADEVDDVISVCKELGTNLKLSDVAVRTAQGMPFDIISYPVGPLYERLLKTADRVIEHPYSDQYGSPMKTCVFGDTKVTLKTRDAGARYALDEVCGKCQHFPCDEGLYFVSALPDKTFSACQMNGFRRKADADINATLSHMFEVVSRAKHIPISQGTNND